MKSLIILLVLCGLGIAVFKAYKANQEETSESRTVKSLPPTVQHTVAQMDAASQNAFFNEYEKKKKKVSIAYIVWIILGWHYLYLKKVGLQFAFWFTLGGFGIWWIADLFRMPSLVRGANEMIARDALQTLSIGNQFRNSASSQIQRSVLTDPTEKA